MLIHETLSLHVRLPPMAKHRCMAVVEVIMLERGGDGVVSGRYALGWALLPLFRASTTTLASLRLAQE
jgi:hypothetical protein